MERMRNLNPAHAHLNTEGTYDPSCMTMALGTHSKTPYKKQEYKETYQGDKPILVVCTDEGLMECKNGKVFNSGNHPIEMMCPMLHFRDAGFTNFDIATTSGKPVVLEMWAYPHKDEAFKEFHETIKAQMESPKTVADIKSLDPYSAIFIPGGHGAMLNLPFNPALGKLLHEAHEKGLPTVTLCHGPAALLSTALDGREFAYEGYKITCFTDKTDVFSPKVGYLPGQMPWKCQSSLEEKGITVINTKETGATTVDRELITGDSPDAADNLGIFAAPLLVKHANEHSM